MGRTNQTVSLTEFATFQRAFAALSEKVVSQEDRIEALTDELTNLKSVFEDYALEDGDEDDVVNLNDFMDADEDDIIAPKDPKDPSESWMSLAEECAAIARIRIRSYILSDPVPVPVPVPVLDMKVTEATRHVLHNLCITTKGEFLIWRQENGEKGMLSRSPFYSMVEQLSATHWKTLAAPTHSCISAYERILPGYKICKT